MQRIDVRVKARSQSYEIRIGAGLVSNLGKEARASLDSTARRVAIISNGTVFDLYGEGSSRSLRAEGFAVSRWLIGDGERHKSLHSLSQALAFLSDKGFERSDVVIALGGGVVGDLAGFAAAAYMRGIDFIQVPTTLLAQIDASIGGKTGVNLPTGKNLVGAFHQPRLVLIDTDSLASLPRRELTAGWCEAIKHGAVGNRKLFDQTREFLRRPARKRLSEIIAAHCRFKTSIAARDEREEVTRADHHSRRILNFGHTTAHAIESLTNYRRFRHGEAVGYGMLVAGEISKNLGMLSASELELLRQAVRECGPLPRAHDLPADDVMKVLARDKKSVAGTVKWILLERLGRPRILDGREIPTAVLRSSLDAGLKDPCLI